MKKQNITILLFISHFFVLASCTTFNHKNPYPEMITINFTESNAYFFNNSSDKLIINLEGSGWDSVLGVKDTSKWTSTRIGAQLLQVLGDDYSILIPEKFNRQPGLVYSKDTEDRSKYSFQNLLDCYLKSINEFLDEFTFSSIVLVGTSEGALMIPYIYEKMEKKELVNGMVSFAFGGLSLYESYELLSDATYPPPEWKEMYSNILNTFSTDMDNKQSFTENYYGLTYLWYSSFIFQRPYEKYLEIDIPILFIHGKNDLQVAVQSTQFIQDNISNNKYEYKYYKWGHGPSNSSEIRTLRTDIAEWILNLDKQ